MSAVCGSDWSVVWWLVFVVNVVVGVVVIVRCFATGGAVIVAVVDDAAFGVGCLCRGSAIVFSVISTATIAITVAIVDEILLISSIDQIRM